MSHDDDTPIMRHQHDQQSPGAPASSLDMAWYQFTKDNREFRNEVKDGFRDVNVRLSGIETRLQDGRSTMDMHSKQIAELISDCADADLRLDALEKDNDRRNTLDAESKQPNTIKMAILVAACSTLGSTLAMWLLQSLSQHVVTKGGTP